MGRHAQDSQHIEGAYRLTPWGLSVDRGVGVSKCLPICSKSTMTS